MTLSRVDPSAADIVRWMQKAVADALDVPSESVDPAAPFTSYGLDSIAAFTLTVGLAEWLERDLPASLFWEFSTITELATHLAETGEMPYAQPGL